jgi:hypothetical protein
MFTFERDTDHARPIAATEDFSRVVYMTPEVSVEDELPEEEEAAITEIIGSLSLSARRHLVEEISSSFFDRWDTPRGQRMVPIPNCQDGRELVYVPGVAGSGKSRFTAAYVQGYHWLFPKNRIYLISEKDSDEALDDMGLVTRIPLEELRPTEEEETEPSALAKALGGGGATKRRAKRMTYVDHTQFANSLILFDDIDSIMDKELMKGVHALARSVIHVGHSAHICCVFTSHEHLGGHLTREIIKAAHRICFFPRRNASEITVFFDTYLRGFRRNVLPMVLSAHEERDTWWCCFYRHSPSHLLTQRHILAVH